MVDAFGDDKGYYQRLWVIRKSQVTIPEGFRVALDLEIGNMIHNFEPGGEI